MPHPLVLALFQDTPSATEAARRLHGLGLARGDLSLVVGRHELESPLAEQMEATPGSDIEDSRPAGLLGEIGGYLLAAVAIVLPGVGKVVSAGPLAAEFGEWAGHAAGHLASVLRSAGLSEEQSAQWEARIANGALILGAHVRQGDGGPVRETLLEAGADEVVTAEWP
jgi:hypothetical protein